MYFVLVCNIKEAICLQDCYWVHILNKYRMISLDLGPLHRHHDLVLSKIVVMDAREGLLQFPENFVFSLRLRTWLCNLNTLNLGI